MSYEHVSIENNLTLVQLQPEQADQLFELTDKNRDYLGRFLPWPPYVKSIEDSRKHIEETLESRANDSRYTYGIEFDAKIVGNISLRNMNDESSSPEIGYWMSPDYSGRGLMTKSVQALTNLGIATLGLEKIIIRADPENIASNKVAEKAGYNFVGFETDNGKPLNVWSTESK